jgi:ubiquinone/menaquinone biosynthesis C-methylase UbiE/DNA-binding transcriptional ArsR family regulator
MPILWMVESGTGERMARAGLMLKAMADPTRQRLLRVLSCNELTVSELVEVLDQPQSTVSRHLGVLRESGLLADRRFGSSVRYAALPPNPVPPQGQAGGNGHNESGHVAALRDRLLDWAGQTELDEATCGRLAAVLSRRRTQADGFFDVVGARWDQLRIEAFGQAFHLEALTALLPAEWVVADIGTGTGYLLGVLASRFRKVIAVDPAEAMLAVARHRAEVKAARNVEFRQGSLEELPIAPAEVDLAIASLVLHHVEQPTDALAELARCLRPGGWLLVIEQEPHAFAEFHERMGDRWWGFEPAALADQARAAGFGAVTTRPLVSARPANGKTIDAPALFALTARRET